MKHIFTVLFVTSLMSMNADTVDAGCLHRRHSRHCDHCETAGPVAAPLYAAHGPECHHCGPTTDCGCHAVGPVSAMYSGRHRVGHRGYTGYEGLYNMDGGGLNGRYPYHSYRRPWAHPGPKSTNVSIVW